MKKGMQVINTFIVITVSVAMVVVAGLAIKNIVEQQGEQVEGGGQSFIECAQGKDIEVLSACYKNTLLSIRLKNNRNIVFGDFFLVDFTYQNGSMELVPTPPKTYLKEYEIKTIIVPYKGDTETIRVIPKVGGEEYGCATSIAEYKNIRECGNEV